MRDRQGQELQVGDRVRMFGTVVGQDDRGGVLVGVPGPCGVEASGWGEGGVATGVGLAALRGRPGAISTCDAGDVLLVEHRPAGLSGPPETSPRSGAAETDTAALNDEEV